MHAPKSPAYKYTYATKRLRNLARALEGELGRKNGRPRVELVDRLLVTLEKLEKIEREPATAELLAIRRDMKALESRIGSIEAREAFKGIR